MRRSGIAGFEESVEDGVRRSPFVTLRETERYLGCSLRQLLSTPEELLQWMMGECGASSGWRWTEHKSQMAHESALLRSVKCETADGKRFLIVHASFASEGAPVCYGMQVTLGKHDSELAETRTLRLLVEYPNAESLRAFEDACRRTASSASAVATPPPAPAISNEDLPAGAIR